ncbi:asparagine synthase [Microbacterium excoecariae]|uniref:asparagine synthase n=1 Tax=Microbacterium excoecariae TaxID=2715210 RepID=UPI00140C178C|nr:asparagine synthase [Microbacterium excoecariae]
MRRNAEAIEEGVAIALAAARLQVKNRILVDTIADGDDFAPEVFGGDAREALLGLAAEQDEAAASMSKLRLKAWGRHSDPHGTHDYRDRDVRNLRRRAKQYAGVAKRLRLLAESDDEVHRLVEDARDAAWHDVEVNIDSRLRIEAMRPDDDPEYARMREARMQALRMVDLERLASEAKKRRKRAESSD